MAEGTKMNIFGEEINQNQDHCIPSIFRYPFNEIHQIIYPILCRDGKGFEQSEKECRSTLVVLEGITFGHHMLNFPFHSLPKEVTSCLLIRFEQPRSMEKHGVHRRHPGEDMCFGEAPDDPCISEKIHPKSNAVQ